MRVALPAGIKRGAAEYVKVPGVGWPTQECSEMKQTMDRRQFMQLAGMGGVVFVSGLAGFVPAAEAEKRAPHEDFYFVQLSDAHWGFEGAKVNPDAKGTLPKAIAAVNALQPAPEFVVFTGDLTHSTDDPMERRRRLGEFRELIKGLNVKKIYFMPGEHDASLDVGLAYQEYFGEMHYSFAHRGVHFIALDNVSDPHAQLGDAQLQWLQQDLAKLKKDQRIIVLAHRPLFDLAPSWDWTTADGGRALELLMPFANVTVFYGHIHQEHHHMTGHIAHHSAKSLMFPLPAPLSVPKKMPLPWDPEAPYRGLGFREIDVEHEGLEVQELPVVRT